MDQRRNTCRASGRLRSARPSQHSESQAGAGDWRPRAVVFDLDGTLVDSFRAIQSSVNHVRARYGLGALSESIVRAAVGHGLVKLLERTVGCGAESENVRRYLSHHPRVIGWGTRVLPGVRRTLAALRHRGCKLAICSNKPLSLTRRLLRGVRLDDHFDAVLGPERVPHPKPHPSMLTRALQKLDVSPAEALYVGDMTVDIDFARAAGVAVWVIPTGTDSREILRRARPDRIMNGFSELLAVVPGRVKPARPAGQARR